TTCMCSASSSTLLIHFMLLPPPTSTLFPYTTLFRSAGFCLHPASVLAGLRAPAATLPASPGGYHRPRQEIAYRLRPVRFCLVVRSEEHTSELQSRENLVCRLLLEKKNQ